MASTLSLERLEFKQVSVRANLKIAVERDAVFPQLKFDLGDYEQSFRSSLTYDMSEAADPRFFVLSYGVKLLGRAEKVAPYEVEIESLAFMHYEGDDLEGADRFRAVRLSGYQIIHGAIREMLANITARARHGLLQLPSRNFNTVAKEESDADEATRQGYLQNMLPTKALSQQKKLAVTNPVKGKLDIDDES